MKEISVNLFGNNVQKMIQFVQPIMLNLTIVNGILTILLVSNAKGLGRPKKGMIPSEMMSVENVGFIVLTIELIEHTLQLSICISNAKWTVEICGMIQQIPQIFQQ